jgi:spermidine synthase
MSTEFLGHHAILDLYHCTERGLLDDRKGLRNLFRKTAELLECTMIGEMFHQFTPQGVSGVIVIAESHLTVHTWPELGYAAVDLYTCGDPGLLDTMPGILKEALGAQEIEFQKLPRGHVPEKPAYLRQPTLVLSPRGLSADGNWLTDAWADEILWTIQVKRIIRDDKSAFQRVQVVDTERLGRILVLDGNIQCAEADEAGYHEMIVHPALCRQGAPSPKDGRRVLIIGGGDGGAAREVMRHHDVAHLDLVDIDSKVIDVAREFLPGVWRHPDGDKKLEDDERFHLHIADGVKWLQNVGKKGGAERYDLIIVDASDPVGPGTVLYTDDFYRSIKNALREGGATCVQGGSFWYLPEVFRTVYHGLKKQFPIVKPMECFTAVYPGGVWNLVMATLGDDPAKPNVARADMLEDLSWYSTSGHRACFGIPPKAWDVLKKKPKKLKRIAKEMTEASDT